MHSGSSFLFRQLFVLFFYLLLQFALYRIFRSQFGDTARRRRLLLSGLIAINLPWLYLTIHFIFFRQPPNSYLLFGAIFGWFIISVSYLLYFGIFRAGYGLWEVMKPKPARSESPAPNLARRAFLQKATLGFGGIVLLAAARGIQLSRGSLRLERVTIYLPNLPAAFDGLRIAQLSDFHSGPYMSAEQMREIRQTVETLKPDVYFLTGDFVDAFSEQVPPFVQAFENLRGGMGIFTVLGNHDYFADVTSVEAGLAAANLPLLRNAHHIFERRGEQLAIIGVDDLWASRRKDRGPDIAHAMRDLPKNIFKICLSHQPGYWKEIKKHRVDLTVCGHTHGGQVGIAGTQISLARIAGPYVAGLYQEEGMQLYVNRGLGVVGIPVRVGMPPEITELILRRV